jgi:glycerol-3-phosphate dehydrogenase
MTAAGFDRAAAIERLGTEQFDVLVIGAGATGAGVALDAASRGLRTALVDAHDIAYGTSSKSSKMIHGGIRYLQQGDVRLVWQALRERRHLLANAPHLVRPLGFMIPVYRHGGLIPRFLARLFGIVLWAYDLVGGASVVGKHRRLSKDEAVALMPSLKAEDITSALLYFDARTDDARLTLAVARTAADHGAAVVNYARFVELHKDEAGHAAGARVDTGDRMLDVAARCVVNAAGVWIDEVEAVDQGPGHELMRPARGVHIVVPTTALQNEDVAVILAVAKGTGTGSVFAVPWIDGGFTYVGTTDTDFSGPLDDPFITADEVDVLLAHLNPSITTPIDRDDVVGSWAGLRPLLKGASDAKTADLSRRHRVTRWPSDVVSIAGGKLTTYRAMAQDTVDEALRVIGRTASCKTKRLALHGAAGYDQVGDGGLGDDVRDRLVHRYGVDAATVIALATSDPALGQPLVPGLPYLRAEALYAAQHEMVVELDDIFARRTRARLLARDATAAVAEDVAALVAPVLGWSVEQQRSHVERYRASVEAERRSFGSAAAVAATGVAAGAGRELAEGWVPGFKPWGALRRS